MKLPTVPLAGVIGSPIAHSKSPQLHRHWLDTSKLNGFYIPMEVDSSDLKSVLHAMPKMGFVGTNVTIPHKEQVLKIADVVTDRAKKIGAANTLTFLEDGAIHADNTDGYGFLENLRAGAPDWQATAGPAFVIGAGGASRAVIVALLDAGVPEIKLTNRTRSRAENLQAEFGDRISVVDWIGPEEAMAAASLVVNTSSLGMSGHPELEMPFDRLQAKAVVTDLVYSPLNTELLQSAKTMGCKTVDGLGMLLFQGVPGFERWFGRRPVVTEATRRAVLS